MVYYCYNLWFKGHITRHDLIWTEGCCTTGWWKNPEFNRNLTYLLRALDESEAPDPPTPTFIERVKSERCTTWTHAQSLLSVLSTKWRYGMKTTTSCANSETGHACGRPLPSLNSDYDLKMRRVERVERNANRTFIRPCDVRLFLSRSDPLRSAQVRSTQIRPWVEPFR